MYFPRQAICGRYAASGGEPPPSGRHRSWSRASRCRPTRRGSHSSDRHCSGGGGGAGGRTRRAWRRRGRRRSDRSHARRRTRVGRPARRGQLDWRPELVAGRRASCSSPARATIRHEQTPAYSGAKIIYTINENVAGRDLRRLRGRRRAEIASAGRRLRRAALARRATLSRRSHVGRLQAADDVACGYRRRRAEGAARGCRRKILEHHRRRRRIAQPSPDGKWIAFLSDRDGWDHLYVMPAAGGAAVQITKGKFEAWRPQWSPDSTRIAFDANEPDHTAIAISTSRRSARRSRARRRLTRSPAAAAPTSRRMWSPDGTRLVYQHTDPHNSADLWVVDATSAANAGCACPTRCRRRWIARRSSSRNRQLRRARRSDRCRPGCSCRRVSIARRNTPRSSGSTATA